jgi:hypothetical protein
MEEKVPPKKVYVPECFIAGFRGPPHGLESRGNLDVPALALALLDLAGRNEPSDKPVTLRTTARKFIDPNLSGEHNFIAKSEVAELIKELFVSGKHVGALATLREFGKLGYTCDDIAGISREYARIDRTDSEQLCVMFGCWPLQRR